MTTNRKGAVMKSKIIEEQIKALREKVFAIQEGVSELRHYGLRNDLIYHAIQKSSQKFNKSLKPIAIGDVKAIISGIENLYDYMFPKSRGHKS